MACHWHWCTFNAMWCTCEIRCSTETQTLSGTDHPDSTPKRPLNGVLYRGSDGKLCLSPRWYSFSVW